jgi:hypothetical protein
MQASYSGLPAGTVAKVENVATDVSSQRIVSTATISDSNSSFKVVTAIIPSNNYKSLHIEIWVNRARFDELLPEMTNIANSLKANSGFNLTEALSPDPTILGSYKSTVLIRKVKYAVSLTPTETGNSNVLIAKSGLPATWPTTSFRLTYSTVSEFLRIGSILYERVLPPCSLSVPIMRKMKWKTERIALYGSAIALG